MENNGNKLIKDWVYILRQKLFKRFLLFIINIKEEKMNKDNISGFQNENNFVIPENWLEFWFEHVSKVYLWNCNGKL